MKNNENTFIELAEQAIMKMRSYEKVSDEEYLKLVKLLRILSEEYSNTEFIHKKLADTIIGLQMGMLTTASSSRENNEMQRLYGRLDDIEEATTTLLLGL